MNIHDINLYIDMYGRVCVCEILCKSYIRI